MRKDYFIVLFNDTDHWQSAIFDATKYVVESLQDTLKDDNLEIIRHQIVVLASTYSLLGIQLEEVTENKFKDAYSYIDKSLYCDFIMFEDLGKKCSPYTNIYYDISNKQLDYFWG